MEVIEKRSHYYSEHEGEKYIKVYFLGDEELVKEDINKFLSLVLNSNPPEGQEYKAQKYTLIEDTNTTSFTVLCSRNCDNLIDNFRYLV